VELERAGVAGQEGRAAVAALIGGRRGAAAGHTVDGRTAVLQRLRLGRPAVVFQPKQERVGVLLIARTDRHKGIGSCYVYVRDADVLHAELLAKGANVQGEPVSRPWGLREFRVLDPEGNQLTFGQPFE